MDTEMDNLIAIEQESLNKIEQITSLSELEQIRIEYLGKSSVLNQQMKILGSLTPEERKNFGGALNQTKQSITQAIDEKRKKLEQQAINIKLNSEKIDVTLPWHSYSVGKIHPLTQVIDEVTAILGTMGFSVHEGPEIEDDFHNFTALNVPQNHPARQMQDSFYLNDQSTLLRTHTSSVQIRSMMQGKPPVRIISPGRVYRCDWDITHTPMFHQVEGLLIDKDINMGHLKGCLMEFLQRFFEIEDLPVRMRPSFFPFTEPSTEVDIGCLRQNGELKIGAGSDWLEILGAGMVHPNVLKNVGIDPEQYQGFAFGMGLERLAMLKYGIADLRNFFDNDIRWLTHYGFSPFDIPSLVGGLSR
jgi:phenylalanyl-tRNA synthetase alpha chain